MAETVGFPNVNVALAEGQSEDGKTVSVKITKSWQFLLQALWKGLATANGAIQQSSAVSGWASPTGTGSRATWDMDFVQVVSNPPTQVEMQALSDQVTLVGRRLGQLEKDLLTLGGIKT